jgi:hypothetical protein
MEGVGGMHCYRTYVVGEELTVKYVGTIINSLRDAIIDSSKKKQHGTPNRAPTVLMYFGGTQVKLKQNIH